MSSDTTPGTTAPAAVGIGARVVVEEAQALLGDRFAEVRTDPDGGLRVTVIDLDDEDVAAITAVADRLGIAGRVRIERADPVAVETWDRLRHDLRRLAGARPPVLSQYPMPGLRYSRPPVEILVHADAEATAAELHAAYGEFVSLTVGALPYPLPATTPHRARSARRVDEQNTVDPSELRVALDGRLSVRTGQSVTHGLLLTNLTDHSIHLRTPGYLVASIVDDAGAVVGGPVGAGTQPLVIFTAEPGETVRVPLLVGTTSFDAALGYTVPPGAWRLVASMNLGDGRTLTTPPLAVTITP